jgi:sulfane dehydrogenase subunit SoxC
VPDIDPAQHKLVIHGMVKQPLVFSLDALERYPMVSASASSNAAATVRRCSP